VITLNIIITGNGGQLAYELKRIAPSDVVVVAVGIAELNITDKAAVLALFEKVQPHVLMNAAAYTAVDKAESDAELAYAVNEGGARNLAEACAQYNARMLHVSTDFVFDGNSTTPYGPDEAPNPLSVYGASKLAGDIAVRATLPSSSVVVRTSWLYSAHGNNFVKTMLRLMADKPELGIIYDQVGTPTWAKWLAQWLWQVVKLPEVSGIYHWTDAGVASWFDFAIAIQELGLEKGLLKSSIPVKPIPASQYPTPAKRPSYSVLDKRSTEEAAGLNTVHWRKQLSLMMDELSS